MTVERIIEDWQNLRFVWGATDCCQFVGRCIEAVKGENPVRRIRYGTEDQAKTLLDNTGLENLATSVFGPPVARPPRDNDVVLVNDGQQDVLGFVWQARILLRTPEGLVDWPLEHARLTWAP